MVPHMLTPDLVVEKATRYRVRPDSPQFSVMLALNLQLFSTSESSAARSSTADGFGEAAGVGAATADAARRAATVVRVNFMLICGDES